MQRPGESHFEKKKDVWLGSDSGVSGEHCDKIVSDVARRVRRDYQVPTDRTLQLLKRVKYDIKLTKWGKIEDILLNW
jgi:hypothetical protein